MHKTFTILLLALAILSVVSQPTVVSTSFADKNFQDNPDGWTVTGGKPGFSVCSGVKIFGGYKYFGARVAAVKLFQLPPHYAVNLKVQFWKVDSWDNEQFHIWIDDQHIYKQAFQANDGQQLCQGSGGWNELSVNIGLSVLHTGPTAVVVFTSNLDEGADNESWGIREFQLSVEQCPQGCSTCSKGDTPESCRPWVSVQSFWTGGVPAKVSLEGWSIYNGGSEPYVCAGVPVIGGFARFGSKGSMKGTIKLPPHYRLKIKALVLKLDSWDNEVVLIGTDGKMIWKRAFVSDDGYFTPICGAGNPNWKQLFARVEVDLDHTEDSISIDLVNNLNESPDNESLGFRDFYVFAATCAPNCKECTGPNPADCKSCLNGWSLVGGQCGPLDNFVLLEQSFVEEKFDGLNGWVLKNNKDGQQFSKCGQYLVGGFNVLGAGGSAMKQFNLPPHKRIRISGTIYKIDSWDNEWMVVLVDGNKVWVRQWNPQTGGGNLCGQGWNDSIEKFDEILTHNAAVVEVVLTSSLDEDASNESWGFRDFRIFYEPAAGQCATLFTEFDYKGESYEFCSKSPSFKNENMPTNIKSIKVPPQGRVTLFENSDYNGKSMVFTSDEPRINYHQKALVQLSGQVDGEWIELHHE